MNLQARKMIEMHNEGKLSEAFIIMYGIQGDLPTREEYSSMTESQRSEFWEDKMESRFGKRWRRYIKAPTFMKLVEKANWKIEGF